MADQTDARETGLRAVSAGKSNVWCGGVGGVGLPPLSLVKRQETFVYTTT